MLVNISGDVSGCERSGAHRLEAVLDEKTFRRRVCATPPMGGREAESSASAREAMSFSPRTDELLTWCLVVPSLDLLWAANRDFL